MFKIESYITPIIINYIDKYVKDFRPQNAQVSLWGGEVTFQNLDIRLDILQQELHLPLTIVSGHIHELTIRIPWTKIASEPIQININTIEFVVKLKSDDSENVPKKETEIVPTAPISQEPPGYMASLINKIANNISVKLNNIIFKYIEEDIVMSMNIQLLSIDSTDSKWQPAFVDINSSRVVLKKVINVTDLTICLDKRNAQGKIDVCQEPILYRCSLQARMIRKYNLTTAHLSSTTRIDIFTDFIDFKVSVQQYPMLIRLYLLIQMLKESRVNVRVRHRKSGDGASDNMDGIGDGSYVTWMLNLLPEIFPKDDEVEEHDPQGHIYHTGFYANKVNVTLKSQELVSGSIIQSNTSIKYHPFLKITLYGMYFDAITIGRCWYNMRGGVSYVGVFPVGTCTCGKKHNFPTIFLAGRKLKDDKRTFLADSLKDPDCCENNELNRVYNRDHDTYYAVNTEASLLQKTPAIAFDITNFRYLLDDAKTFASQSVSEMDFNSVAEEYRIRTFFGSFNAKFDTSSMHMWRTLNDHYVQYDYSAPYLKVASDEMTLAQLTPPSTDDFDSLVHSIPLRRFDFSFRKSKIEVHYVDGDHLQAKSSSEFLKLPFFVVNLDHVGVNITSPLYPSKLIHTTCQLPKPPEKLKSNCYWKIETAISDCSTEIMHITSRFPVFHITSAETSYETLLKPDFFRLIQMPTIICNIRIPTMAFRFNKPQYFILSLLADAYANRDFSLLAKNIKHVQTSDVTNPDLPVLDLVVKELQMFATLVDNTVGVTGVCKSVSGMASCPSNERNAGILSNEAIDRDVLSFIVQMPYDLSRILRPPILKLNMDKVVLNMDSLLQEFFNYKLAWESLSFDSQVSSTDEKLSLRKQWPRKNSRMNRSLNRTESVHSNSAATLVTVSSAKSKPKESQGFTKWYNLVKYLVVHLEIKPLSIYCPIQLLPNSIGPLATFKLPSLSIQTSKFKHNISATPSFPIALTDGTWSREKTGFPWNIELNNLCCSTIEESKESIFLNPVNTKITLDITDKLKDSEASREEISFVIHLDTMPIEFNFNATQLQNIYRSATMLSACFMSTAQSSSAQLIEAPAMPPTFFDLQINEFICETTNSERSSEEVVVESETSQSKFNFLVQWTITKLAVNMFGREGLDDIKVSFELEDIISSVDKQSTYIKIKTKCGSISGIREMKGPTKTVDALTVLSRSDGPMVDNAQDTFFELVATKATTHVVHNRWGTKKANLGRISDDTMTEVMVTMQSLDVKFELDMLSIVLPIMSCLSPADATIADDVNGNVGSSLSVKQLPLIFFNCKGFQMWIPTNSSMDQSDVLILKMNAITISHNVENPIQRKPIREDIYTKACQLRIIHTPGSEIEDRQYELLFKNISIGTGNWKEILNFTQPSNSNFELNPAFDWNHQTQKPSLHLNTIFEDFIVSVIYAPSIVFQNVLVCGEALEVNCVNDLHIKTTLSDLSLINNVAIDIGKMLTATRRKHEQQLSGAKTIWPQPIQRKTRRMSKSQAQKLVQEVEQSENDSGFKSHSRKDDSLCERKAKNNVKPPFMLSFVGGLFNVQFYKTLKNNHNESLSNEPLCAVSVMQPNLFITDTATEYSRQFSMFNLTISLFDKQIHQESSEEFGEIIFNTTIGRMDESGIPPCMIFMKNSIQYPSNEVHLVCNVRKPIKLRLTPVNLEKIFAIKDLLTPIFHHKSATIDDQALRTIGRNNKIKTIKQQLLNANSIDFSMAKTDICMLTPNSCALNFSFYALDAKLAIQKTMERLQISCTIESFSINSEYSMILQPMTARCGCTLNQSKWNKQLTTAVDFQSDYIGFQVCPNDVMTIAKTQKEFLVCISRGLATFAVVELDDDVNDSIASLYASPASQRPAAPKRIHTPTPTECAEHSVEEHFQDDLRLGAFQYVKASMADALPLAYQINMFTEDESLMISWRYPHPRTISHMRVYPVPLQLSVNINCQLEYYLEAQAAFIPFCSFQIDEKNSHELALSKRKVTASVWRIVVSNPLASAPIDADVEDYNVFRDMLQPQALIGCIRIDSMFCHRNVPMIQANVCVKNLSLSILNSINLSNNNQMPSILKQYTLKTNAHLLSTQEYCRIDFPIIKANMCLFSDADWTLYNEFVVGLSVYDYSYLQMERCIENVSIQSYIENSSDARKGLNVCYAMVDKLHIKYGAYIGHTIAVSDQIWSGVFGTSERRNSIPILTRFVVANSTSIPFKFGQHNTDEQILLRPNECHFYAFHRPDQKQMLRVSIESESEVGVDAAATFPIDDSQEMQFVSINYDRVLLISQKKLSTTQRLITIKGQIEVMNMCQQAFQIHYKNNSMLRSEAEDGQIKLNSQCVILMNGETGGSIYAKCDPNTDHVIRLHLAGTDGSGWSGEIPLHAASTNVPWLVKVPTKNPQKYASFSVRIHREFIANPNLLTERHQRLLIVIWPLFTARSFLPHHLIACDKENDRKYALMGKGQRDDFQVAGTFDTNHEFLFNIDNDPSCTNDNWKTVLSYKSVDRKTLFSIPERLRNIDDILKELERPEEVKWPYTNEEESFIDRMSTPQRSALPLYKFSPSRELSCSLLLDVLPWCLFINTIGCEMQLVNSTDGNAYTIEPNHIGTPFMITTAFNISVNFEGGWKNSCLIYLNDCKPVHRSQLYYKLPQEGSILIEFLTNGGLSKFKLTSKIENSIRILTLEPYFVVCNLSKHALKVHPFCVPRNEKLHFETQPDIRWHLQTIDVPSNKKSTTTLSKGIGITAFQSLSQKPLIDAATERNINYFIVVSIDGNDFSAPIMVSKTITRTAFGLRHDDNKNTAFALSALEYHGQIYVILYDDRYPFAEIENRTSIHLYIAESESNDVSKHSKPKRSVHDDNFQWHREIPAYKRVNYTPPSVNENFPEKPIGTVTLILGSTNKLTSSITVQWSLPIKVDECEEKFLNLPLFGDIKLTLFKASKTICIVIEHINVRTEFNVKNILSKLSSPSRVDSSHLGEEEATAKSLLISNVAPILDRQHHELPPSNLAVPSKTFLFLNTEVFFKAITVTLYDENKQRMHEKHEIVSLYLDNVALFYITSNRTVELSLGNIQLDNNLFSLGNYDFPVVISGQKPLVDSSFEISSLFAIGASKTALQQNNLAFFKVLLDNRTFSPDEVHCSIKPFTAYVEDKFIAVILDFLIENLPTNIVHSPTANQVEKISCVSGEVIVPKLLAEQVITLLTDPLRLSCVTIKPLNILLSVHTCMRLYIALDHSPLDFSAFEVKNIYTTNMKLGYNVGMHYVSGALFGAGWVVGSLEILGSPSGLARSVSTGLWDFVSLPVQGLFRGPWGFLLGLTNGSASLLKNVTAGTVNSVTKLAASFARNLDRLTLDDEHLQRTEALRRSRPQGITDGFTQGLTGFGINLLGAVGGIARHALEAKSSVGVFTGLGRGLVGVVTKPISGAAELLALTGQGVLHSVGFNTMPVPRPIERRHQPHVMTSTKILWKISSEPLRFAAAASAKLSDQPNVERNVTIALTSKMLIIISMETHSILEMSPVSEVSATIDQKQPSVVILTKTDDSESNLEYQFHYNRILQYVTKSHEQLGINKPIEPNLSSTVANLPEENSRKVALNMDPDIAAYLVKYIQLVHFSSK